MTDIAHQVCPQEQRQARVLREWMSSSVNRRQVISRVPQKAASLIPTYNQAIDSYQNSEPRSFYRHNKHQDSYLDAHNLVASRKNDYAEDP